MITGSFLKVLGHRLGSHLGLQMSPDFPYRNSKDYSYIEIPCEGLWSDTDGVLHTEGKRNQHLRVMPACTVEVKGLNKFLIEPNPELAKWGSMQGGYYLHAGMERQCPGFYISLRRDIVLAEIPYAIRVYMRQ